MSTITSIKPQKNQKRVNIYIDNKFAFGLDLENFVRFHLKIGMELEDEKVDEIVRKGEFQKVLDKLLKFATLRPRSEKEIKDYLKRKRVHESLYEDLFERLNHLELINDEKFAEWWVNQRIEFKNKSQKDLIFELRKKGINKEVIDSVINKSQIDETKVIKTLIEKKKYKWEKFDEETRKQKITQYLLGKGFDWNIISDVLK